LCVRLVRRRVLGWEIRARLLGHGGGSRGGQRQR
jgi:hypothetical protein